MALILDNLSKFYDGRKVLDHFNLRIEDGEACAIMGPSGCGKSTLLSIIAGLSPADSGTVYWHKPKDDKDIGSKRLSMVFQDNRLIPWKDVWGNIAFVFKRKVPKIERERLCKEALQIVELDDSATLLPKQLSGGMARRVAIARAVARESDILIMDEPFTGLDSKLKQRIIERLKHLCHERQTTLIIATHSEDEAIGLGCHIVRMI